MHTVDRTEVATDLIRWIWKMQLYFRFVKRPGESHLALDGKKNCINSVHLQNAIVFPAW